MNRHNRPKKMPGFNAEASLYNTNCYNNIIGTLEIPSTDQEVVPQLYRVVCSINDDNELHCGIEDYTKGISIPLF